MMQGMRQNVANHHKLVFPSTRKNINFASKLRLIACMKKINSDYTPWCMRKVQQRERDILSRSWAIFSNAEQR